MSKLIWAICLLIFALKDKNCHKSVHHWRIFAHLPLVGRWSSLCSRSDQSSLYHQTSSSGVTGFWCHKSFWKDIRDEALVVVNVWGGCLNLTYVWWQRVYLRRHNEPFQWKRASPAVRGFALNHVRSIYFAHPCLSLDLRLTSKPHQSPNKTMSHQFCGQRKGFSLVVWKE